MLHRVTNLISVIRYVQKVLTYVILVIMYVVLGNTSHSRHLVCSEVFNIRYACHKVGCIE